MNFEHRYMPIHKAAKLAGVTTKTMRKWLEKELGLVFHNGPYQRSLVSESDVRAVIDKRLPSRDWSRPKQMSA